MIIAESVRLTEIAYIKKLHMAYTTQATADKARASGKKYIEIIKQQFMNVRIVIICHLEFQTTVFAVRK